MPIKQTGVVKAILEGNTPGQAEMVYDLLEYLSVRGSANYAVGPLDGRGVARFIHSLPVNLQRIMMEGLAPHDLEYVMPLLQALRVESFRVLSGTRDCFKAAKSVLFGECTDFTPELVQEVKNYLILGTHTLTDNEALHLGAFMMKTDTKDLFALWGAIQNNVKNMFTMRPLLSERLLNEVPRRDSDLSP